MSGRALGLLHEELSGLGRRVERKSSLLASVGGPVTVSAHIDRHGFVTGEQGRIRHAASELTGRAPSAGLATSICQRSANEVLYAYDARTGVPLAEATISHADHCGLGPGLHPTTDYHTNHEATTLLAIQSATDVLMGTAERRRKQT